MWTCKNCGEELEDQFDSCWKCGTGKDGSPRPIREEPDTTMKERGGESEDGPSVESQSFNQVQEAPGTAGGKGSLILGFCSLFSALGIFTSIGCGIYVFFQANPLYGILVGVLGAVYHSGLFIVFCEVNRIIEERNPRAPRPPYKQSKPNPAHPIGR